ncbi:uncharacterized protein LOC105771931 [Gossypium raimondii]|uniref:uncharacterized protein LOC105771931 n=1 Tax=Gossypium raimondii TaxID=29730 RepID=UPI00063AAD97|nr:uncharacterized protein LOC105771931 [Gossypium raimondii]
MAPSADSNFVDPMSSAFFGQCLVQSFPHHDMMKLEGNNFVQWQQHIRLIDKLLTSWLLSTISSSLLSCFTSAQSACDGWNITNRLFAASTSVKISRIKHDLHSLKKEPLPFSRLVNVLLEFGSRQVRAVREIPIQANHVVASDVTVVVDSGSGEGRMTVGLRGRGSWLCMQCQIYNRFGHIVQRCFYRFNRSYDGPNTSTMVRFSPSVYNRQEKVRASQARFFCDENEVGFVGDSNGQWSIGPSGCYERHRPHYAGQSAGQYRRSDSRQNFGPIHGQQHS